MTEEEFLQHRSAVSVRKAEKPKKMRERADLVWSEIQTQQYQFERQTAELAELDTLTLDHLRAYFHVRAIVVPKVAP